MSRIVLDEEEADVTISPLIDCVFLLLIFFLVSTMFKKENKDIDIELPESATSIKVLPLSDFTAIGIKSEGQLFLDGKPSSKTHIHLYLSRLGLNGSERTIRLDVDKETPFHHVVEVIDICRFRGLQNIRIKTKDKG